MSAWHQAVAASLVVACASIPAAGAAQGHDRSFWSGIARNRFEVPAGESADALVLELSAFLGSPDPELRDDFAYSIAAAWIYRDRRVSEKVLHELLRAWSANLRVGLGGTGSDTLFLRAFSALDLSLLAALDNQHPFLDVAEPGVHLWDKGPLVDPARYAATQNAKDLLRSLYVALVRNTAAPEPPRAEILKTLEKLGG